MMQVLLGIPPVQYCKILKTWCVVQLMRAVPGLIPRSNASTTPMVLEAYDFCNADLVVSWAGTHSPVIWENVAGQRQIPMRWHRENVDRSSMQIDVPSAINGTAATGSPEHGHPTSSKGDTVSPPLNDSGINTRELLYEFAGKLCDQFQQKVRISIEPVNEKNENGNALFSGVDELVNQYAQTMKRTSGANSTIHQSGVFGKLANHCARNGRLPQVEKRVGEIDREKTLHGNKVTQRFKTCPKRQNKPGYNGITKEKAA